MHRVDQTKFVGHVPSENPDDAGNCMQACFASLFELPLDVVPHFASMPLETWWTSLLDWSASQGFALVTTESALTGVYGICTGQSPRGAFKHVVVTRGSDVAHDPHPSRDGILDQQEYWYFVPMDPASARITV